MEYEYDGEKGDMLCHIEGLEAKMERLKATVDAKEKALLGYEESIEDLVAENERLKKKVRIIAECHKIILDAFAANAKHQFGLKEENVRLKAELAGAKAEIERLGSESLCGTCENYNPVSSGGCDATYRECTIEITECSAHQKANWIDEEEESE
jgi:hypothetical protein